jgi:hypothetical protein
MVLAILGGKRSDDPCSWVVPVGKNNSWFTAYLDDIADFLRHSPY